MKSAFDSIARPALLFALLPLLISAACTNNNPRSADSLLKAQGSVLQGPPRTPHNKAKYLFYLHGRIIEEKGIRPVDPKYGVYEYEQILNTFKNLGFTVISEARPKGTDVKKYASKIVDQVKILLGAGVPARQITIVGASKGAVIAMLASTLLHNRDVNFVIMSNCNDWVAENFDINLHGNVLSIYDVKDEFGHSCQRLFEGSTGLNKKKEVELKVGTGHAILYKPMKEWVDLVVQWAEGL